MRVLLDTTLLIDVLRRRQTALDLFEKIASQAEELATSVISVAEIYAGQRAGEEFMTARLLTQFTIYSVTAALAQKGGLLKNASGRKGETLLLDDMIIAATALEHNFVLHTFNRKHFKGTGVPFYNDGEN